jgi:hypothetical protein
MIVNSATTQISFFPFVSFDDVAAGGGGADSFLIQQSGFAILQQDGFKLIADTANSQVNIQFWHKNTKTLVEADRDIVLVGSKITILTPSLTAISDVAEDLDTILIRVLYEDVLKWEYLATWSNESTNINASFKQWDEVSPVAPQWIQL